ncbi:MAG: phosphatase PAP2 family protein [Spirochaetes bacterium]|nr:phosphatase PAP2 family protein [Spirochaetota bacterium]
MKNYYQNIIYISLLFIVIDLIRRNYLKNFWTRIKTEFKWKNLKWIILFLIGLAFFFYFIDLPLLSSIQKITNGPVKRILHYLNIFGDGRVLFPFLFIIYLSALFFDQPKLRHLISIAILSALLAGLVGQVIKIITARTRPYAEMDPLQFFNYKIIYLKSKYFSPTFKSFPSGHTTNAFSFMIPFILYFKNKMIRMLLVIVPVLTGIARIYYSKHWPSDVVFGAFLGIYIGMILYMNNRSRLGEKI